MHACVALLSTDNYMLSLHDITVVQNIGLHRGTSSNYQHIQVLIQYDQI
jgi:hypothetical protein